MKKDYAIQVASSNLRYGIGVTNEVGMEFKDMGVKRVLLITDENLKNLTPVQRSIESLNSESIDFELFTDVRVESSPFLLLFFCLSELSHISEVTLDSLYGSVPI